MGKFTVQQMLEDIKSVKDCYTMAEKKVFTDKYGLTAKKISDIVEGILLLCKKDRSGRSKFDEYDVRAFMALSDYPGTYKKMENFLLDENILFVKYMMDYYLEKIKADKLEHTLSWPSSNFKYARIPYGKIAMIQNYQWFLKFYNEHSPEGIAKQEAADSMVEIVCSKFDQQLKEFKEKLLDYAEAQARKAWQTAPDKIEKLKKQIAELNKKIKAKEEGVKNHTVTWAGLIHDKEYNELNRIKGNFSAEEVRLSYMLKTWKTEDNFARKCREEADDEFEHKKEEMAKKLVSKGIDPVKMEITHVDTDPKYIEMVVEDGIKKLYCRSIIAAEYSEKVTVHFRFIITDRKQRR